MEVAASNPSSNPSRSGCHNAASYMSSRARPSTKQHSNLRRAFPCQLFSPSHPTALPVKDTALQAAKVTRWYRFLWIRLSQPKDSFYSSGFLSQPRAWAIWWRSSAMELTERLKWQRRTLLSGIVLTAVTATVGAKQDEASRRLDTLRHDNRENARDACRIHRGAEQRGRKWVSIMLMLI